MDAKEQDKMNQGRVIRNALPQLLRILDKRKEGDIARLMQAGKSGNDLRAATAEIIVYTELKNEFLRNVAEVDNLETRLRR